MKSTGYLFNDPSQFTVADCKDTQGHIHCSATGRPAIEELHTQSARNPLPNFYKNLSVRENIIVWVSNEEKEDNSLSQLDSVSRVGLLHLIS